MVRVKAVNKPTWNWIKQSFRFFRRSVRYPESPRDSSVVAQIAHADGDNIFPVPPDCGSGNGIAADDFPIFRDGFRRFADHHTVEPGAVEVVDRSSHNIKPASLPFRRQGEMNPIERIAVVWRGKAGIVIRIFHCNSLRFPVSADFDFPPGGIIKFRILPAQRFSFVLRINCKRNSLSGKIGARSGKIRNGEHIACGDSEIGQKDGKNPPGFDNR